METAIALFIGAWLSAAGVIAYRQLKKEFREIFEDREKK